MKVSVIIVTYNGMKWIEECLNSILNSSVSAEIIIIDNCSTDNTVQFIKSNFKGVMLIEQKENLGFGKANNIGMSLALYNNSDFVFLLNQDVCVLPNSIEVLIDVAQKKLDYGIISPIQLDYSGEFLEEYFFRFVSKGKGLSFFSDFVLDKEIKEIYDTDFVQAATWLIPSNTLKKIGGFDPIFFHYGEDNNYCQRVLYHGLKIGIASKSFIRHDATQHEKVIEELFSNKYFKTFEKNFYATYANINVPYNKSIILKLKKNLRSLIVTNLLKFNFKKVSGFKKKLTMLDNLDNNTKRSRDINTQIKPNYLNVK